MVGCGAANGAARPRWRGRLGAILALAAAALAAAAPARAEPMALPGDKAKAQTLALESRGSEPGRWGRIEARLRGDATRRYVVRGLDIAAPLSVQVIAEALDAPVEVSLHRHAWSAPLAGGSTGSEGLFRFDGRAQGHVGVTLRSASGAPMRATLLVWQGTPVPRSLAAVYALPGSAGQAPPGARPAVAAPGNDATPGAAPRPAAGAAAGGGLGWAGAAVAGAAVLLALGGALWWWRRRSAGSAAVWLVTALAALAAAGLAPLPPAQAQPAGDYATRIEAAEAHVRTLAAQVADNRAEIERLRLLLESDREAEPDPDRLPTVPLSCRPPLVEGDGIARSGATEAAWRNFERCQACYAQPLADFERQLLLYEKLRAIYTGTRDEVTRAIDLGDKAPKPHSLLESAWAAQKFSIRQSFEGTKKAYDAKLLEFNDRLGEILDRIGRCETELNNNPMWRQTSGLFFHRTMATSYRRTD